MLTPVQLEKIRIVVLKEDETDVLSLLHELGAVQLEQAERDAFFKEATPPDFARKVSDQAFRFEGLAAALPPVPVTERVEVGSIEDLMKMAQEIDIDEQVRDLENLLEDLDLKLNRNRTFSNALGRISGFKSDLAVLTASSVFAGFYTLPKDSVLDFRREIISISKDAIVESYGVDNNNATVLVILPRSEQEAAKLVIEKFKAQKLDLPMDMGSPEEAREKLANEERELLKEKARVESELGKISEKYYSKILALREAFSIEMQRIDAIGKFGESRQVLVIEGWVPKPKLPELERSLASVINGRYTIERVEAKEEEAPTLLQNSPSIRYFEFLVRFFSLPRSSEVDPTPTFAIVFPIFFGLMLGDVGYGAVILLVSIWLVRIAGGRSSARLLPKKIRSFAMSIMSKRTYGTVGKILIPCSITSIIFGFLFNEYFGFALPYSPVLNVTSQLTTLLLITIFIGIAHISLGYIYGIYNGLKTHHMKHVYSRIGWLGLLWSATICLFGVFEILLNVRILPSPLLVAYIGLGLFFVFGGVIGATEGARFVMELPTLIGHTVSYARILGILLASVLLASIVDTTLRQSLARPAIVSVIISVAAFAGVQLLNLILGVFEPSIQGVRLHYVEFYSKFFEGNGQPFRPFSFTRNYTKGRRIEQKPIKPEEIPLRNK